MKNSNLKPANHNTDSSSKTKPADHRKNDHGNSNGRLKKVNIPSIVNLNNNLQKLQAEGYNLITTELSVQAALKKKQEEILALKKKIQELQSKEKEKNSEI